MSSDGAKDRASSPKKQSSGKKRKKIDIDFVRDKLTEVLMEKAPSKLPGMEKILSRVAKGSVPFKTLQTEVYKKYGAAIYRTADEAAAAALRSPRKSGSTPKAGRKPASPHKAANDNAVSTTSSNKGANDNAVSTTSSNKGASPPKASNDKSASPSKTSNDKTASPRKVSKDKAALPRKVSKDKAALPRKASNDKSSSPRKASNDKSSSPRKASNNKAASPRKSDPRPKEKELQDDGEEEEEVQVIRPNNAVDDDLLSTETDDEDYTQTITESEEEDSLTESATEEDGDRGLDWTSLVDTLGKGAHPDKLINIVIRTESDLGPHTPAPVSTPREQPAEEDEEPRWTAFHVFKLECRVHVCMHTLVSNEYFRSRLQGVDKGQKTLVIEATSAKLYAAYVMAIQYLSISNNEQGNISLANQFDIYGVACKLRIRGLIEECQSFIETHLNAESFPDAVQQALDVKDINMFASCYQWLKRNGFKKQMFSSTPRAGGSPRDRISKKGRKPSLANIFKKKSKSDMNSPRDEGTRLTYDAQSRLLCFNEKSVPIDVFKVMRQHEIEMKKKFFKIGAISGKYEDTKLTEEEDGFDDMMQCTLHRKKNVHTKDGMATIFLIYAGRKGEFLIAARILEGGRRFVISSSPTDFDIHGKHYLGECFCNFLGTNFSLFDYGMDLQLAKDNPLQLTRIEHSLVVYKTNVLGRVPNSLQLILPRNPDTEQLDAEFEGKHTIKRDVVTKAFKAKQLKKVFICHTREPQWNDELEAWTMDFRGRVTLASKKNFQIVCDDFGDSVLMLFGKNTKNQFAFDFKSPLTIIQAFGVALSTFADKLAVT